GTSTCRLAVGPAALSRGCGVLTQAVSRAEDNAEASSKGRRTRAGMETTWDRGTGDYAAPLLHPASGARMAPRDHSPLAVRHDPVELPLVVVEHQRQEVTVALPHRQFVQTVQRHPFQRAFRVAGEGRAGETRHQEHEAQPVLAPLAEPRPADGAA